MKISFPVRVYIFALVLRLIPVLLSRGLGIGLDDMFQYDMLARSLAAGNGFRWYAQEDLKQLEPYVDFDLSTAKGYDPEYGLYTSFRAPLYPAFLALVYTFSGVEFSRFFAARLAQAIFLIAPLAPLTYFAGRNFLPHTSFLDERSVEKGSRLAAWIVAWYPMLLIYPLGLATENLFFPLLLISFIFLLKVFRTPTIQNFAASGIFLALTTLTRSSILIFAGFVMLFLFFHFRWKSLPLFLTFFLLITPWGIRNALLHGKVTGLENLMGYNLYLGYHPQGNGSFVFGPSLDLLTIMDDLERDEIGRQKAFEFIRADPGRIMPLFFNRLGFFFGLEKRVLMYFYSNNLLGYIPALPLILISVVLLVPFVFVSSFAALGLTALQRSPQRTLLGILFATYILPYALILSEDRFHLALVPFFAVLAAYAMVLTRERRLREASGRYFVLAVILLLLLVTNWGLELYRDADKIAQLLDPNGNTAHFPY